ncbi:MAG TPA: FKBP-type peptidyl-prolyl cis-trans isomerase [Opitutaceae bacterium]|jgi:FKBP-type peptidyl-prolyl cis-trans isomerase
MRSTVYLALLGVILLTLALVVRSGMLASHHPEEPMSAAMRAVMAETAPQFSSADAAIIRRDFPTAYTTKSGLMYVNLGPGTGDAMPRAGAVVTLEFTARLLDGTPVGSSKTAGGPSTVRIGVGDTTRGLDEALMSMRKGARRMLIIPYWLAYGDAGKPPIIPPRATLVLDVRLLGFR